MDNEELFDSDTSDEDYIPDGKLEEVVSEVESDGDPESGSEDESKCKGRKRVKHTKNSRKRTKVQDFKEETKGEQATELNSIAEEEKKKSADDLWADFMKDTGFKPKSSNSESSNKASCLKPDTDKKIEKMDSQVKVDTSTEKLSKVKITQIFEFAGEEVKVEKEVDANSAEARILSNNTPESSKPKRAGSLSGIGNVLSQLGKKQKISTLEKTKLDWERFKKDENIEEELQIHNKGKDGYLDRQDFLERADLRRFEIEKNIRNVERAKRFNSTL